MKRTVAILAAICIASSTVVAYATDTVTIVLPGGETIEVEQSQDNELQIEFETVDLSEVYGDGSETGDTTVADTEVATSSEKATVSEQGTEITTASEKETAEEETKKSGSDTGSDNTEEATDITEVTEETTETTTQAVVSNITFNDLAGKDWAIPSIQRMASKGILNGVGNGLFAPDSFCKRCDFVIVADKIGNLEATGDVKMEFGDVPSNAYYAQYIQAALDREIIFNSDAFYPEENITRASAAVIIYNMLLETDKISSDYSDKYGSGEELIVNAMRHYTDIDNSGDGAMIAIMALTDEGILTGTNTNLMKFSPGNNMTRAQMAVLFDKVVDKYFS